MAGKADIAIIGAGVSGLATAAYLAKAGVRADVFESQDRVGGRLGSIRQDGYTLDRGFQVFLNGYKEMTALLDTEALELGYFASGALIHGSSEVGAKPVVFANPLKHPSRAPGQLRARWGSVWDKARLGLTVAFAPDSPLPTQGQPMKDWLMMQGFSQRLIDRMMRPFFSGVLLEDELVTDSRYVRYLIGQFGRHRACLPAMGMQAIAEQLAALAPAGAIRLSVTASPLELADMYPHIVDTRPSDGVHPAGFKWVGTQIFYYSTDAEVEQPDWLRVNTVRCGVTNVAVPSAVCPAYAPKGKHLVYASVNRAPHDQEPHTDEVTRQAGALLGVPSDQLELIDTLHVKQALPLLMGQPKGGRPERSIIQQERLNGTSTVWRAGDTLAYPSMNGAALSGRLTAEALLAQLS